MAIKVTIPTALRRFANGQATVEVPGGTISEVLGNLTTEHAQLRPHLYGDDGKLRNFVRVYVNDEDIRAKGDDAPVNEGDEISIVPSIAGGNLAKLDPIIKDRAKLTNEEIKRYSRHLILPEVGMAGQGTDQGREGAAHRLGRPRFAHRAVSRRGRHRHDRHGRVRHGGFHNLQRQILHFTGDVGKHKLKSAEEKLKAINPNLNFISHPVNITSENALDIIRPYDLVMDGTDNFPTRYLVNDACVMLKKPNVYGSIFRFEGRPACSRRISAGRVTAAGIPNRRRPAWCRVARKAACSASFAASSATSRRTKSSSSSSARANRSWDGCCGSTRWK